MSEREYFDAVLDENFQSVFNGTPNETVAWIKENPWAHGLVVCVGRTTDVILVPLYMERSGQPFMFG